MNFDDPHLDWEEVGLLEAFTSLETEAMVIDPSLDHAEDDQDVQSPHIEQDVINQAPSILTPHVGHTVPTIEGTTIEVLAAEPPSSDFPYVYSAETNVFEPLPDDHQLNVSFAEAVDQVAPGLGDWVIEDPSFLLSALSNLPNASTPPNTVVDLTLLSDTSIGPSSGVSTVTHEHLDDASMDASVTPSAYVPSSPSSTLSPTIQPHVRMARQTRQAKRKALSEAERRSKNARRVEQLRKIRRHGIILQKGCARCKDRPCRQFGAKTRCERCVSINTRCSLMEIDEVLDDAQSLDDGQSIDWLQYAASQAPTPTTINSTDGSINQGMNVRLQLAAFSQHLAEHHRKVDLDDAAWITAFASYLSMQSQARATLMAELACIVRHIQ